MNKFEGGVFGPTWEQLDSRRAGREVRPKPWWVKKQAQLLEIGAAREAVYVYDRARIERRVDVAEGA